MKTLIRNCENQYSRAMEKTFAILRHLQNARRIRCKVISPGKNTMTAIIRNPPHRHTAVPSLLQSFQTKLWQERNFVESTFSVRYQSRRSAFKHLFSIRELFFRPCLKIKIQTTRKNGQAFLFRFLEINEWYEWFSSKSILKIFWFLTSAT